MITGSRQTNPDFDTDISRAGVGRIGGKINSFLDGTRGWITANQIESARKTLTHFTAKGGRVWSRVFPSKPVTHQPLDHRGGGGKGEVAVYVAVVRPGLILFEMGGIPNEIAKEAMRRAGHKLSVRTKFITKE